MFRRRGRSRLIRIFALVAVLWCVIMIASSCLDLVKSLTSKIRLDGPGNRKTVFLISPPRTGSTLLGHIFDSYGRVLYIYEPLHAVSQLSLNDRYDRMAIEFLEELVTCNFRTRSLFLLRRIMSSSFSSRSTVLSKRACLNEISLNGKIFCDEVDIKKLKRRCDEDTDITVIKELLFRIPYQNMTLFMRSIRSSHPLSIIYLLRDPRALAWSILRTKFSVGGIRHDLSTKELIAESCGGALGNLQELVGASEEARGDTFVVLYEELVTWPLDSLRAMFKFLQMKLDQNVVDVVRSLTDCTHDTDRHYSIYKNSCSVTHQWRHDMPIDLVLEVESECGGLMRMLSYREIGSDIYLLRNTSVLLWKPDWRNRTWFTSLPTIPRHDKFEENTEIFGQR